MRYVAFASTFRATETILLQKELKTFLDAHPGYRIVATIPGKDTQDGKPLVTVVLQP